MRLPPSLMRLGQLIRKEWLALLHDVTLLVFILFGFTFVIYAQSQSTSMELRHAAVGIVDEDRSALSRRFADALLPPYFGKVTSLRHDEVDAAMEAARVTFALQIPARMEADLRAGKAVTLQLLIDASAVGQAGIGSGYIQSIVQTEALRYFNGAALAQPAVSLAQRYAFNQGQRHEWFSGIAAIIQNITMLAVLLTGAALLRERESGTVEHLLVMPVTPFEIVMAKVIASGTVILAVSTLSILLVLQLAMGVHINGSLPLFMLATVLYLFFTTGLGVFLGTLARSMPQMGLLFILIILPMNLLSGNLTPLESMPEFIQHLTRLSPSTAYVSMAQAILFRDAGLEVVWPELLQVTVIGLAMLALSLRYFRDFLGRQG